ncbi:ubiquitin conjugation factor E4 B [Wickerhamomyces ciferrii]|uniref:RING-type E3 ubiquitin transferase n=1 Tax=Wickerhamomyces ciferrii (strain ATCC 14091 / BCRC 22168 / CBS 111 / JCM 3599 / NBRC 0793 / NRRL Y-1031 F-60-10) TaxID=1206466 RepID=K0KJ06_WICCF|nr:ubiquitin conjugation factor E4 B [Wickerhamomyces ciferrii]CCH41439.1 ubiquitin conjugation factor E4 B [Wickerhamomyces ciferrii]
MSADEIRAKRLARLNSQQASPSPSNISAKSTESIPTTTTKSQISTNNTSSNSTSISEPTSTASSLPPKRPRHESSPEETISAWTQKTFEFILNVTLDNDKANRDLVFLEQTFTELVEENQDPLFNSELTDRVIIERLSEIGVNNPFKYLKDSWSKIQQERRQITLKDPLREQKISVLTEIDRLTSSYGLVSFQIPDMFINGDVETFLKDIISNENSYSDFLIQIINRSNEEGTILEFLNIFIPSLTKLIPNLDLNNPQYTLILNIFQLFINEKSVASVFTQIDGFELNPNIEPSIFETSSILGPIFKLSPLQESVANNNFDRSTEKSKLQIKQIGESLQAEHKILLDRLFFITNKIIRGSEQSRNDLLKYFATIINKNHLRRGDHADFKKLSSNAFVTNISLVLIRLSQPFLDVGFTKIDRIDIDYFSKSSLIDITEETRINSTNSEASDYFKSRASAGNEKPNFISDCFFLTLAYLHYGIGGVLLTESKMKNTIKQAERQVESLRQHVSRPSPMQFFAKTQLKRLEDQLSSLKSQKDALVSFFTHRDLQLEIFEFVTGASAFLIRLIDPVHKYPQAPLKLPLVPDVIGFENVDSADYFREKAPIPFKYYPEYLIEGLINYCHYIAKYIANPMLLNPRLQTFVEFAVTFLRCPELIGNPHLKGHLVEVLFIGSLPTQDNRPGFMIEIFDTNELVNKNLLYALLDFYVIVEKTGASSQFYDKFNARYHLSSILEQIWKNPLYQNQLKWQSDNNEEFFIRFVARMLNDLTFLLDEALRQLGEVHSVQTEQELRLKGQSSIEGTDEELQSRLQSAENQAKSFVGLANKGIDLFGLFTQEVPRAFTKSEIVGRLASMLDYNLDSLVGPRCTNLKVKNPENYRFNPRELLVNISKVFINLSKETEFIQAVSQDSRSFKIEIFEKAKSILANRNIANGEFIDKFIGFAYKAESKRLEEEEEEQELGEVPDEFLDPLMYTIMKDPVTLPTSKVNIDRSTIKAHLLSDSTDPFSRQPLKFEDVIPNEDLRQQILEFRQKAKQEQIDKDSTMKDV